MSSDTAGIKRDFTVNWKPTLGTIAKADMLSANDSGRSLTPQSTGGLSPALSAFLDGNEEFRTSGSTQDAAPATVSFTASRKHFRHTENASGVAVPEASNVPFLSADELISLDGTSSNYEAQPRGG